ncbi:hypothetical protein Btru_000023 [Bulinus truncatus]|nr:hypothetical protein Btru_000023 [Bulinus truncatus]
MSRHKQIAQVPMSRHKQIAQVPMSRHKQIAQVPMSRHKQIAQVPMSRHKQIAQVPMSRHKQIAQSARLMTLIVIRLDNSWYKTRDINWFMSHDVKRYRPASTMYSTKTTYKLINKSQNKKKKHLKLVRHIDVKKTLPWDSSICVNTSRDKSLRPRVVKKLITKNIPQPDYIGVPCSEFQFIDGRPINIGERLLCKKNYKVADWASEEKHEVQIQQCHRWGSGSSTITNTILPSNYYIVSDGLDLGDSISNAAQLEDRTSTSFNKLIIKLL